MTCCATPYARGWVVLANVVRALGPAAGRIRGAVTHILDRLEKRGIVERVRGTKDRRKVFVRVRAESLAPLLPQYEANGRAYLSLVEPYSDQDLRLICEYLEKVSALSEQQLARLISDRSARARKT